ncbi:hypothetical protein [Neisseria meningitidis]|uniref:hypothetical protein n=1 Tax=Neisseria meningitidis TaxID=487 RepID=UPI000349E5EF|nr:hypothetical protein [Neisseria meningitidis]
MPSETFPFQTAWFYSNLNRADRSQKHTFAIPAQALPLYAPNPNPPHSRRHYSGLNFRGCTRLADMLPRTKPRIRLHGSGYISNTGIVFRKTVKSASASQYI